MATRFKSTCFLFIAFLFISGGLKAHNIRTEVHTKTSGSQLELRKFNHNSLKEFKVQKEFIYTENSSETVSIWNRFWTWFWQQVGDTLGKRSGSLLTYVVIIAGIGGLVFAIIKLSGMDVIQIMTGKSAEMEMPYSESLENIHEINFDHNIANAVNKKNYRLAVRILYLKSLKKLSDSGLIDWQINKTNTAYINELNHPEKKKEFLSLTKQFEYIWYGEFYLKSNGYQHIENSFKDFIKKI